MPASSAHRTVQAVLAAATLSLVAACGGGGGGGDASSPAIPSTSQPVALAPAITRLVVAGDSLADVGTFGYKATIQNAANPAAGYPMYPELVAQQLGTGALCSSFASTNQGTTFGTRSACTDFAVAGASIVNPVTRGGDTSPFSLKNQLEAAVAANGGAWKPGDLVMVDAGGNDAAGLADTYRGTLSGGADDDAVFLALLGQQLSGSTIDNALAQSSGGSVAATLYMQQLARTYWTTVKANTLDKGATHVAILNLPDITLTPRVRDFASGIAAQQGAAAAADFQAAVRSWIVAFNTELARQAAGESRVVVVDYFNEFTAENTAPSQDGLTNTLQAACPATVDFPQCTDAALDAAPPSAGLGAGWWKTWLYSDRFHPSPRGHELLAAAVVRAVQAAGWR